MALASGGEQVIVVLDARMGEVYYGRFSRAVPLGPVVVCQPSALPLPDSAGWLACGNGLAAYPLLRARLAGCVHLATRTDARLPAPSPVSPRHAWRAARVSMRLQRRRCMCATRSR
jgi:tRNA threonylcarbamoyladenosine biosynthesis protein TsaB